MRDRAIVFCALSTGLRRTELVRLDLDQLNPARTTCAAPSGPACCAYAAREAPSAPCLSADARAALADYLEHERPGDADDGSAALFLAARSISSRRPGGRPSVGTINDVCERVGAWHDGDQPDPERRLGGLHPHDLRHTFGFRLAEETGKDAYELERRLGHRSQRCIARYTNPPEHLSAGFAEHL